MIKTQCLNCKEKEDLTTIYPQNFQESMLSNEVFSARRTTEHWHYRMVRCKNCDQLFSNPILEKEKLESLYEFSLLTYEKEIDNIRDSYMYHLKQFEPYFTFRNTAIEIGCGNGFFLDALIELGYQNVVGYEPSTDAVKKSDNKNIKKMFFENDLIDNESADLICSFQTLDHMINPLQILEKCKNVLRPGGSLFFVTHNERSLQSKILKEKSPIIDVEHIYLFNKKTLSKVFENAGFKVVQVFEIKNRYSLHYWLRMTPLPLKSVLLPIFNKIIPASLKITLRAGNIGIFAQK